VSNGDTEVLLAMYENYGIDMLDQLEGMFAFALWDGRRQVLHLARDRYGVKPLYVSQGRTSLAFASELRALSDLGTRVDPTAVSLYLATNYIPAPHTIWENIIHLPPGHRMEVDTKGRSGRPIRWFDPVAEVDRFVTGAADLDRRASLVTALGDAVDRRLEADVPVGIFLSGGLDSSIITALAVERKDHVVTLSVGYDDAPALDERAMARRVADHLGTDHREITVTAEDGLRAVDDVLARVDEPFADDSLLPTYLLCSAARREVTVALSGDGGDELFGGYRKYLGTRWASIPGAARGASFLDWTTQRVPDGRTTPIANYVRILRRFSRGVSSDLVAQQRGWVGHTDAGSVRSLLASPLEGPDPLRSRLAEELSRTKHWQDPILRVLMSDIGFVLPYDMLAKTDKASMWNSLEVRSPFLDRSVLPLAFSFSGDDHVGLRRTKRVLRSLVSDRLPAEVARRGKRGFGVPLGEWMRGPLRHLPYDRLDPANLASTGILRPDTVRDVIREHMEGNLDRSWELWNLIVLQTWAEQHGVEFPKPENAT
jgi:asparagine synthase (glutamine-hydrolysing)